MTPAALPDPTAGDAAAPATVLATGAAEASAAPLDRDLVEALRQAGLASARGALVDLATRRCRVTWSLDLRGVTWKRSDEALDDALSFASTLAAELAAKPIGAAVVHRRSPHRRVHAWRIDARNAVLVQVHALDAQASAADLEPMIVRLINGLAICAGEAARAAGPDAPGGPAWPLVDRRARKPMPATGWAALGLLGAAALLAGWMIVAHVPAAEAEAAAPATVELARLHAVAERVIVRDLTTLLVGGDYGDLQDRLTSDAELGLFHGAIVVNVKGQVVARAGKVPDVAIGAVVPEAIVRAATRTRDLAVSGQRFGQVLLLPAPAAIAPPAAAAAGGRSGLGTIASLMLAALLAAGALFALALRQRRGGGAPGARAAMDPQR